MFRRLHKTLPKDPEFPADLEKLGYFITPNDEIRSLTDPTREFHYFISKNPRVLDVQREAMNTCIRNNLAPRLLAAGLHPTLLSNSSPLPSPTTTPHIPILTTANLPTAPRILLHFGESSQDLAIFAYRTLGKSSIASGSILDFVSAAKARQTPSFIDRTPGETAIVIANPGQLLWYRRGGRAVSEMTWEALPRKTGVDARMRVDPVKNRVPGHRDPEEHMESVMGFIKSRMKEGAKLEIAAVGDGVEVVVGFLDRNWGEWEGRVAVLGVGLGHMFRAAEEVGNESFRHFWGKRARAYLTHNEPAGTQLQGRKQIGCNCYSSGEKTHVECVMPMAHTYILDFFKTVHNFPEHEERLAPEEATKEELEKVVKWVDGKEGQTGEETTEEPLFTMSKLDLSEEWDKA